MHLQLLRVCILVPVVKGFWYYFPMQFKRHTLHVFIFRTQIWSRIELSVAQASRQISLSSKALAINRDTLPIKKGVVMIYMNCSFLEQQMNCGLSVLQSSMSGFLRVSYILHSVRKWISSSTLRWHTGQIRCSLSIGLGFTCLPVSIISLWFDNLNLVSFCLIFVFLICSKYSSLPISCFISPQVLNFDSGFLI